MPAVPRHTARSGSPTPVSCVASGRISSCQLRTGASGRLIDPPVRRILVQPQPSFRAGNRPYIVDPISLRGRERMIAVRQQDGVAGANGGGDALAVGRVAHLTPDAGRRLV